MSRLEPPSYGGGHPQHHQRHHHHNQTLTQTHKRKAIVAAHLSELMSSNVAPLAPDRRILKATRVQNPLEEGDGAGWSKSGLPNAIVISDDSKT